MRVRFRFIHVGARGSTYAKATAGRGDAAHPLLRFFATANPESYFVSGALLARLRTVTMA